MLHSFNRIWIHGIWATKERYPLIQPAVEKQIHQQLSTEFTDCGCPTRIINGMPDHVHSLFLLNPQKALTDIIKQVKGATSYWIDEQPLLQDKFAWQTGFATYSVSESQLEKVYLYILNQKQHHLKKSFSEEFDELIRLHRSQIE